MPSETRKLQAHWRTYRINRVPHLEVCRLAKLCWFPINPFSIEDADVLIADLPHRGRQKQAVCPGPPGRRNPLLTTWQLVATLPEGSSTPLPKPITSPWGSRTLTTTTEFLTLSNTRLDESA